MTDTPILNDFFNDLRQHVSGEVRTDPYSRVLYSTDASIYQVMPYGVLIPHTLEDIHAAVELAARYRLPILPRTGGSSLAGQAVNEALVIDMSRHIDQVLEVNQEEHWVRVQPGKVLGDLNLYLKPTGLQFGPDPASADRAAMGGIVANNSTGAHSILYGMTADHVLEVKVILSDGTLTSFGPIEEDALEAFMDRPGLEGQLYRDVRNLTRENVATILAGTPRHWRRCGGYNLDRFVQGANFRVSQDRRFNLAKLISGSEGTLAVMTEIKLNLVPLPRRTALAIVQFHSLYEALSATPVMLQVEPSAIELMDNLGLTLCRDVPEYARLLNTFVEGTPNCILITEFYGENEKELEAKVDRLRTHLINERINASIVPALSPQLQANVWKVRKVGLGLMMGVKGDHKPIPFIEDAAVPVAHLADYVTQIESFCNSLGTQVAYYAHASAGCIHIRPMINSKDATDVVKLAQISEFSISLLGEYGGSFSSEHGDGRSRSWLNPRFYGQQLYDLYRSVKSTFDPENILNPGIIIDAPHISENLRYGDNYKTIPIQPNLDFSDYLGFERAVEMCNGAGICRKLSYDTMCPSFMVTRDEEHSTRGRANALRAAMSGLLPAEELTSPRMYQVMDLCVECKACKAECPSSVDMARIKFEFLVQYYQTHPLPFRSRMFADIARLSRLGSGGLAPLANWSLQSKVIRAGMERFIGVSSRRTIPGFARQPFTDWFIHHQENGRSRAYGDGNRAQVVLFNDTFNTYNDPGVAIAATQVLEAAGFEVLLPGHRCCGRPMISKGLVDQARAAARDTVNRLAPFAEKGIPIVGLEPSCILSLRDEYLSLLPGDQRVRKVADACLTFEEFIAGLADEGDLNLAFQPVTQRVLLHGHCHQKSLVGTMPAKRLLSLPGYQVEEVDSGCCGMAGAFGYEVEHYDLSIAMAERRLLPAVRAQAQGTLIVAAGFSCRQQILDGSGRQALHPAEVLRDALKTNL